MTLPPQNDDPRPVVLQEPERDLAPAWKNAGNEGFVLRPEEDGVPNLHPGWAQVMAPAEAPIWQGTPLKDRRFFGLQGVMPMLPFALFGAFVAINMGFEPGFVLFGLVAGFIFVRRINRNASAGAPPDRIYLLTNRAAYLARTQGAALTDIQAFPITPTMRLGLGPRSVAFTTRRNANGKEEAEGFLDIEGASTVHAMIRDVQKGLA